MGSLSVIEETVDNRSVMEETADIIFFYSVSQMIDLPVIIPSHSSFGNDDVFNISDICLLEISVDCDFHTYKDVTLDVAHNPSPYLSTKECLATSMKSVDLMYRNPNSGFSIIFDTGASLGISFDNKYFVGPIRPLSNHNLGGLSGGMEISGIGVVK